jgi:hypothetical protein
MRWVRRLGPCLNSWNEQILFSISIKMARKINAQHLTQMTGVIYWTILNKYSRRITPRCKQRLTRHYKVLYIRSHYLTVFMIVGKHCTLNCPCVYACSSQWKHSPTKATHWNTTINSRQLQTSCFPQQELRTSTAAILHRLINSDDRNWHHANLQ